MKIHRTYTVEEAASALDVHKNTVREWIRAGLPVLNEKRPLLIRGAELSTFLRVRGTSKKCKCQVWEVYCMSCRAPKSPAGEMGEYVPTSGKSYVIMPRLSKPGVRTWATRQVLMTFMSYGAVARDRQGTILRTLGSPVAATSANVKEIADAVIRGLRDAGASV